MEEKIQRLRGDRNIVEWIYPLQPVYLYTYSLRKLRRHCISEGNNAYLKNYVAAFFYRSGMTMGIVATETGSLISLKMGSQSGRGQVAALDPKDKRSREQQGHTGNQNALARRDLWQWLIDHDVPRNEIYGQFKLYNRKTPKSGGQKST